MYKTREQRIKEVEDQARENEAARARVARELAAVDAEIDRIDTTGDGSTSKAAVLMAQKTTLVQQSEFMMKRQVKLSALLQRARSPDGDKHEAHLRELLRKVADLDKRAAVDLEASRQRFEQYARDASTLVLEAQHTEAAMLEARGDDKDLAYRYGANYRGSPWPGEAGTHGLQAAANVVLGRSADPLRYAAAVTANNTAPLRAQVGALTEVANRAVELARTATRSVRAR